MLLELIRQCFYHVQGEASCEWLLFVSAGFGMRQGLDSQPDARGIVARIKYVETRNPDVLHKIIAKLNLLVTVICKGVSDQHLPRIDHYPGHIQIVLIKRDVRIDYRYVTYVGNDVRDKKDDEKGGNLVDSHLSWHICEFEDVIDPLDEKDIEQEILVKSTQAGLGVRVCIDIFSKFLVDHDEEYEVATTQN